MRMIYCSNCVRQRGHRRAFGWGTFFMVMLTLGLWILVLPFYPKRCVICGQKYTVNVWTALAENEQRGVAAAVAAIVLIIIGVAWYGSYDQPPGVGKEEGPSVNKFASDGPVSAPAPKPISVREEREHMTEKAQITSFSADDLMFRCAVNYEVAMEMGIYAQEYLDKLEFMNKIVRISGTVSGVRSGNHGLLTRVDIQAGPCPDPKANAIKCSIADGHLLMAGSIQEGQQIVVSGRFSKYGGLPIKREFPIHGCGYYVDLEDCSVEK